MKYGKIIDGNITLYNGDDISKVEKISGYVYVSENAKLSAPVLKYVGGGIYVSENAKIYAPVLQSVGGYVDVNANAKLYAPVLQSVGGYVYVSANAKIYAPVLQSVGGGIYVRAKAKLYAPVLQSVGGYVDVSANATFKHSENIKKLQLQTRELCLRFNFECFLSIGYLFADNILAKIINKKQGIYKIQICGKSELSYCVEKDGVYSHGKTIKEAKESLIYKISSRDTSEYKKWSLDTKISFEAAIKSYRVITGACEYGTRSFINSLGKVPTKLTPQVIIDLTQGQYGSDTYKQFFGVK